MRGRERLKPEHGFYTGCVAAHTQYRATALHEKERLDKRKKKTGEE
jgi:hypothetical protein